MSLVRYEPWGLGGLQEEVNRLFNRWSDSDSSSAVTAGWIPPVDIHEYGDRFQLYVDLPGVEPNSVELTLDNGVLTIRGERPAPAAPEGQQATQRRTERGHGRFYRRFILPDTVDADNVKAADRQGVLEVTIPKQAKAQPRRIAVAA